MDVYHLVGALLLEWPSQFCACACSKTVWREVCVQLQFSIVRNSNMQRPEYHVKMHMLGKTMEDVVVGRFCIHFYCENQMIEARMASAFHDSKCASNSSVFDRTCRTWPCMSILCETAETYMKYHEVMCPGDLHRFTPFRLPVCDTGHGTKSIQLETCEVHKVIECCMSWIHGHRSVQGQV